MEDKILEASSNRKKKKKGYAFNLEVFEVDGDKIYKVKNMPMKYFKMATNAVKDKFK